ncbi:redoxin domain-containing protein [Tepidiforma sp.]|uniref:redoxin domain-containing protein n=1 Tax=Tepidiforma sp. TaxID=2682230 RepID=UPI002ADD58AB|nr:redoxin domain-containing protein [Tepidiforma sp.]
MSATEGANGHGPGVRAPIAPGEQAPDFELPAVPDGGEPFTVRLRDLLARGRVLLIFYQDDGMPICTSELKAFAQEYDLLREDGVQVFGINTNGIGSHGKFQERDHFPFPLISDFYGEAVRAYGFWDPEERKSRRGVVVVGRDGRVEYVLPHFNPGSLAAFEGVFRGLGLLGDPGQGG